MLSCRESLTIEFAGRWPFCRNSKKSLKLIGIASRRECQLKIQVKSHVDYEYDTFRFRVSAIHSDTTDRIRQAFHDLMKLRAAQQLCSCTDKASPLIRTQKGGNAIAVDFGWFCTKCLHALEQMITTDVTEALSCTVGSPRSEYPDPIHQTVEFRNAIAEFEDGRLITLPPFAIQKYAVTIGQFQAFTDETGYVTTAERTGQYGEDTYKHGPTIEAIRPRDRLNLPACSVSYLDAVAYCHWSGKRLPSESELLAASLVDERIVTSREKQTLLFGPDGRFRASQFPNALVDLGPQWVQGIAAEGHAVVRTGPFLIREHEWRSRQSRHEWPVDAYDIMCGFRTCVTIDA